jgi:hypothetical protein
MLTNRPTDWRDGQTIFNFLEWLRRKGYDTNENYRMADPFHIPNAKLNRLFEEFINKKEEEIRATDEERNGDIQL